MTRSLVLYFALTVIIIVFMGDAFSKPSGSVPYDVLLIGGRVIDPANGFNGIMDVAVAGGRISRVAPSIHRELSRSVIDVSGCIVTPGFIDLHEHVFHTFDPPGQWVVPDHHSFQSGVTTIVDAGTAGAENFERFKQSVIDRSRTRILAFLNIASPGKNASQDDPSMFNVALAAAVAKRYPEIIVGFKSSDYDSNGIKPYGGNRTPWASVDSALASGELVGRPVMVSFNPRKADGVWPARSLRELLRVKLRPGDILTCCFSPRIPVIQTNLELNPDLLAGRERGILFDTAHGAGSFVFRNAVPAIHHGFIPDCISTDLHGPGLAHGVVDLVTIMSKHLACGMNLESVIRCTTINPAHAIGRPDLGTLSIGAVADIAVVRLDKGAFSFMDTGGGRIDGNFMLRAVMTVFGGAIVFDPFGMNAPVWEDIPSDSNYWKNSTGQTW